MMNSILRIYILAVLLAICAIIILINTYQYLEGLGTFYAHEFPLKYLKKNNMNHENYIDHHTQSFELHVKQNQHPTSCQNFSNTLEGKSQDSFKTHKKVLETRRFPTVQRPRTCKNCNIYNFTSIIQPKSICDGDKPIDLLVFLTSVPKAVAAREAIRDTWLKHSKGNTANVRHLFLFGGGWPKAQQMILYEESAKYGDILQDDYKDAYYNLSYKMISGYKWAIKHCPQAKFTLRTADDIYIHIPNVLRWIKGHGPQNMHAQIGHIFQKMIVYRPKDKKWHISMKEFPEGHYPPYAVGTAFLYSMAAVKEIIEAAPNVPFFPIEDAWFGMVMREIKMPVKDHHGFDQLLHGSRLAEFKACKCPSKGRFLALHLVPTNGMHRLWLLCPSSQLT